MRFHVVGLPHTQTTDAFSSCAYTNKVRGFCSMMMSLGHEVFLYAGEENQAPCIEHIICATEIERQEIVGDKHYTEASFDPDAPHWLEFNMSAAKAISRRKKPRDFLCLIAGRSQELIAQVHKHMQAVEFGVGYTGTFSQYRVFESYAWMHMHYGAEAQRRTPHDLSGVDGHWYDTVIPGYLDPTPFALPIPGPRSQKEPYALYVGRLIDRKGYQIAIDTCRAAGVKLVIAGPGSPIKGDNIEYVGVVHAERRNELMAGAVALFAPTRYIEPFGNVAIEAQACGTPVITTDWGAFTETVEPGVTGFRCHTMQDFYYALRAAPLLVRDTIRNRALRLYSYDVIGRKYEAYFERLLRLWDGGWDEIRK